jgi:4-amino-4-deoxy-L-arabinose transferase-like glycosyltransferase
MTVVTLLAALLAAATLGGLILAGRGRSIIAESWREALLVVAIFNGLCLAAVTEILSVFSALTAPSLVLIWGIGLACQAPLWWRVFRNLRTTKQRIARIGWVDGSLLAAAVAILAWTAFIALVAPPNNFDSMTYHMSRVAHWRQNQTIAFYPTHIERQLSFPPFAEFVVAHLVIVSGGDRLANLVQWFSLLGCALGISLVAGQFGAGRRGQILSALFGLTLPMAILQASSTQNDLVVSFWLVCFCYFSLRFVQNHGWPLAAAAGGALGLALLTKATAYIFAPGLLCAIILTGRRTWTRGATLKLGGVCLLAVALSTPYYSRNMSTFGHPFGSEGRRALADLSVRTTVANLVRGVAAHLDVPPNRFRLADRAHALADRVDWALGLRPYGSELEAPLVRRVGDWRINLVSDDLAGAPLHLLVMIPVLVGCVLWRSRPAGTIDPRFFILGLLVSIVLFSALLIWMPFSVRFHMTLFLLAAPLVGAAFARVPDRRLVVGLGLLLMAQSTYPLLGNVRRPLVGPRSILRLPRGIQYFSALDRADRDGLAGAIGLLHTRADAVLGLLIGADSYEYPYWALLPGVQRRTTRVCHVAVTNLSRRSEQERPCVPTVVVSDRATAQTLTIGGVLYAAAWHNGRFVVYVPK